MQSKMKRMDAYFVCCSISERFISFAPERAYGFKYPSQRFPDPKSTRRRAEWRFKRASLKPWKRGLSAPTTVQPLLHVLQ